MASTEVIESHNTNIAIKHTGAIHVSNSLSLLQRKAANVLLKHAFKDLDKKETHIVKISDIARDLGWSETSNVNEKLKSAIRKLNVTQVEWNILGKDSKNEWGTTTILAEAKIKNGYCEYAYSPTMRRLQSNPSLYARLDLLVQQSFGRNYALVLWEFLSEALCSRKLNATKTDWISIVNFRKLMGVESPYYDDFSKLNSKVITPAIQEVNEKSDIQVEMSTKRESRKIVALSFDVSRKEAHLISYKKQQNQNQKEETIRNDGIENWARILEEEFSFGRKNAEQLLNEIRTYSNKEISASLEHVREKQKDGEIRNIQAYTATALKKRYEPQKENLIANAKIQKDTFEGEGNLEWKAAKSYMQETLGVAMYTNWIKDLSYLQILDNKIVVVSAKSQFIADWVQQHYANTMLKVWNSLDPNIKELRIVVIN